ncbi:hypothetical protein GQ457_13G019990 [Hibiscus cannabinus]
MNHSRALLVTFWTTWYVRNKVVHDDSVSSPHITLAFVEAFLRETGAIKPAVYLTAIGDRVCWQAPMESIIKVNFDAAFDAQSKSSTSGVLCRNDEVLIMAAYILHHEHVSDAFMAEALSCLQALILSRDLGFSKIVVDGDSLTVIKKLCSVAADKSTISPVIYDIKMVAQGFVHVSFSFVRRQANIAAHTLTSEGKAFHCPMVWIEEVPVTMLVAENDRIVFDLPE